MYKKFLICINGAVLEQDRPNKILQAYPCFRELDHVRKCIYFKLAYA